MIALALIAAAWATPWWVADAEEAAEVEAALEELWPGHPMALRVGAPDGWEDGVWTDNGAFVLAAAGQLRRADAVSDAATQVALARSWSRSLALVPPESETFHLAPLLSPDPDEDEPAGLSTGPMLAAGLGPSWRFPEPTPAYHFMAQAGWRWRWGYLGLLTLFDTAETTETVNHSVGTYHRLTTTAVGGVTVPISGVRYLELELGWGRGFGRLVREEHEALVELWLPAYSLRGRLWEQLDDGVGLGIGGVIGGENGGPGRQRIPASTVRPLYVAIELTASWTPRGETS